MSRSLKQIAEDIGDICHQKNLAYGNSFADAPRILAILYPGGIPVEQFPNALLIVRVVDKLKRIATDNDPFGESPWADVAGYGVLGVKNAEECASRSGCGSSSSIGSDSNEGTGYAVGAPKG